MFFLVRPRVLGNWSSDILEKKEPWKYPEEFDGPEKDTDTLRNHVAGRV